MSLRRVRFPLSLCFLLAGVTVCCTHDRWLFQLLVSYLTLLLAWTSTDCYWRIIARLLLRRCFKRARLRTFARNPRWCRVKGFSARAPERNKSHVAPVRRTQSEIRKRPRNPPPHTPRDSSCAAEQRFRQNTVEEKVFNAALLWNRPPSHSDTCLSSYSGNDDDIELLSGAVECFGNLRGAYSLQADLDILSRPLNQEHDDCDAASTLRWLEEEYNKEKSAVCVCVCCLIAMH